ncbi:MAG: hypothetical protein A2287_10990 [Candidatus Melainabacteria bacterium RIFOXYA12_FULL_32_12]|nr:MAG: hypothetical protein A2255_10170 [Candidatus Melainabacteria bacterium RIFOXYA2_FULL_32_9]OGI31889.1 MAG: hypothetical protein A2287_10990 [Candidatus Melainabacteria bacterium RIFOXYA12_FULL_32_12]
MVKMQDFLFGNFIIPAYFSSKGLNRYKHYYELEKRDFLTLKELEDIQWSRLKSIIDHCYRNIPYYTNLFNQLNIIPSDINSLAMYSSLIPELKKQDIRENFDKLIDPRLPKNKICSDSTSGSTGIPLQLARSVEDQEFGFSLRYRSNAWCGWNFYDKSVWFVSDTRHITEISKLKGKIGLWIKRRLLIDTKNCTKTNMYKWVDQIKSFKPKQVYGYSSLLAEFSQFLLENNIKIEGIEGVYSTAEVLKDRKIMSQAFNAPVYDQYGASEVPCIAHECKKGNMHINIDEVLIEFADIDSNSDIKKIICTPLYIYGMPLLRYEIGDTAIPALKQCDCGLPYPVMELKVGRASDNILSPTGKIVSGITFGWYLTDATNGIRRFQLIQENISDFIISIEAESDLNEKNEKTIRELMHEMLNTMDINVKFEYPEKILPGNNGKYRPIISKVANYSEKSII